MEFTLKKFLSLFFEDREEKIEHPIIKLIKIIQLILLTFLLINLFFDLIPTYRDIILGGIFFLYGLENILSKKISFALLGFALLIIFLFESNKKSPKISHYILHQIFFAENDR